MFYAGPAKKFGQNKLRQILEEKQIPQGSVFLFGLFSGLSLLIFVWIVILFIVGVLDPDNKESDDTFSDDFPMFRGAALIIIANWLIAFNAYGWNKYHVNYKLIFKFESHYSEILEILKRAALFTSIFLLFFVIYCLIFTKDADFYDGLSWIPKEYCALVIWIIIIGYHICPLKDYFNYKGRVYLWKLLKLCFHQPCGKMEFRISWMTDQLISFVGAFKDLQYTFCYWFQKMFNFEKSVCSDHQNPTGFLLSLVPLYMRSVQCLRTCYDDIQSKNFPDFKSNPQMINFGKYLSSVITSIFSYLTKFDIQGVKPIWVAFAIFTTIYSFIWDLKKDWGLLIPGCKGLRPVIQYKKRFYYFAICSNFILRLVWVLSISPDIIDQLGDFNVTPEIFTFFVYLFEAIRRCQWNFIRVENEHVKNFSNFQAVGELGLPMHVYQEYNQQQSHYQQQHFQNKFEKEGGVDVDEEQEDENQNLLKNVKQNNVQRIYYIDKLKGSQNSGVTNNTSFLAKQQFDKIQKSQYDNFYSKQRELQQQVQALTDALKKAKKKFLHQSAKKLHNLESYSRMQHEQVIENQREKPLKED